METQKLATETINVSDLARKIQARLNCIASDNKEWKQKHEEAIAEMAKLLPHGSGFDSGCEIDLDRSDGNKIVITTSFHHMDDGSYDGWSDHDVVIRSDLQFGYTIRVTGMDRKNIKNYIHDVFSNLLTFQI